MALLGIPKAKSASLYNLSGSEHGFGDVVGPFLLARAAAAKEKTYLLLDDRAEHVLKTFLESPGSLPPLSNIVYVRKADLPALADVDRLLETFAGARGGAVVDAANALPKGKPRTVLITQDLHSPHGRPYFPIDFQASGLGEVRGEGGTLYFSPAGLGRDRLGILGDPAVNAYADLSPAAQKAKAASLFADSYMGELLEKRRHPAALLSFAYGIHNEVFATERWQPYPGQFKSYLKGLRRIARQEGRPVVLFSPNKADVLRQALGGEAGAVEEGEAFAKRKALAKGRVYVVSTGNLSNSQFVALTAAADLPYMIEGDSAVSAAVRLGKPFVMMKGPWGLFGIDGLSRALTEAEAGWASRVYPILSEPGNDTPNFSSLDEIHRDASAFKNLRQNSRDWSSSLADIVALSEGSAEPEEIFRRWPDPMLRYSWARLAHEKGSLSTAAFTALKASLPGHEILEAMIRAKEAKNKPPACPALFSGVARD
ncbi:MAG: hypothetical protein EOP11_12875 [Proteobacteria bacterium]|nr:MAG: hypothetical protein EOP11_12875 [Pseudomonadota bacterium]